MSSVIPANIPYGVFMGLLYRRYRIDTRVEVFVADAIDAADTLIQQGCTRTRLLRLFRTFLLRHIPLRWSTSVAALCRQFSTGLKGLGN